MPAIDPLNVLNIFRGFTTIAILIACLGLYDLAMFTAEQKLKEIGIGKVLRASIKNLVYIQVKGLMLLILVSFQRSVPLSYFAATL